MNPISLCYGLNCALTPQRHVEVLSPSTSERGPFGNRVFVHVISKEKVLFSKAGHGMTRVLIWKEESQKYTGRRWPGDN